MISATIHVDSIAYGGIDDTGGEDVTPSPAFRNGFHQYGASRGRDTLKWGGEPYVIWSARNLASHVERIMTRLADGTLKAKTITIEVMSYEGPLQTFVVAGEEGSDG
jgi:hypothetical protein